MRVLILAASIGGLFTATLFWFWQRDLAFALLVAPIGASFAALLAAALLAVLSLFSLLPLRAFLASLSQRFWEVQSWTVRL